MTAQLRELFPSLSDFSVTSPQDIGYNCVAWATGTVEGWWWPGPGFKWPFGSSEDERLLTFVGAFNQLGYERCADGSMEDGYEKIAIYQSNDGLVSHMARQLSNGRWTSKIGMLEDIEHADPSELEGDRYGVVAQYMRRGLDSDGSQIDLV